MKTLRFEKPISAKISALKLARYQKRALTVVSNSINSLLLPVFNIAVSYLVIRQASVDLWGEFVNLMVIVYFGAHIVYWGNKEYLLREFSFNPAQIAAAWQTSLLSRAGLLVLFAAGMALLGAPAGRAGLLILWGLSLVLFQAYEVLILYRKDFPFSILVELAGLAGIALAILWQGAGIGLDGLILLFALTNLLKAGLLLWRYRRETLPGLGRDGGRFQPRYFGLAFPFFLLGFSGMLQSRIDLYSVTYFLSSREVGQYQVFINLMIYLQAISAFILVPFVKSIYRLSYRSIFKISVRLFALGSLLLVPALALAHLVLNRLYHFDLSPYFLVFGGLFVLPVYFYSPIIYALFKAHLESAVIKISFLGAGVNLALNVILVPRVGMLGAVAASAAVQWLTFLAYLWQSRAMRQPDPAEPAST